MDYNGNSLSENPFMKHDGGCKRLFRRPPIVIRETEAKRAEFGIRMRHVEHKADLNTSTDSSAHSDLEYGPGIVEKLRAKFAKLSGAQKEEMKKSSQNKKYSSCDDLLSEEEPPRAQKITNGAFSPNSELSRRTSRSISDMLGSEESERVYTVHRNISVDDENNEKNSIIQLRRRFEKKPSYAPKEPRQSQEPVKLYQKPEAVSVDVISTSRIVREKDNSLSTNVTSKLPQFARPPIPSHSQPIVQRDPPKPARTFENKLPAQKVSNVLKVLNDAKCESEPEFVQIARRLRRFEPDVHEKSTPIITDLKQSSDTVLPAPISKWSRQKPEMPVLSDKARIIRENTDFSSILPQDPHSARVSKLPIPPISGSNDLRVPNDASPPPEEPSPSTFTQTPMQKPIEYPAQKPAGHQFDRNGLTNSVFKYDIPPTKNSSWKTGSSMPTEQPKVTMPTRRIEDIGTKVSSTSQITPVQTLPNVVSISVRGPSSNIIFSNYDKNEDKTTSTSDSVKTVQWNNTWSSAATSPIKPPATYSPSYTSSVSYGKPVSLSTKYVEEKKSQQANNGSSFEPGILSPREKPYGDDVTILKSDASADNTNTNSSAASPEAKVSSYQDSSEESSSSDDDSRDGTGSYEVTPMRPNSLTFSRMTNDEDMGGDGNPITRSLISLVAEEDLADFLVALHEKPVRFSFIEENEKPSTSSILRVRDTKKEIRTKGQTRIRFCTEQPLAYAYLDEITATRGLQWDDGTIVEYSYFKQFEEQELHSSMSLIEQWEEQIASETAASRTASDPSFTESLLESALNSAY